MQIDDNDFYDEDAEESTIDEVARSMRWLARYVAQADIYKKIPKEEAQKILAITNVSERLQASAKAGLDTEFQQRSLIKTMMEARPFLRALCQRVDDFSQLERLDEARRMLEKKYPLH